MRSRVLEIASLFLKLGTIGFGGPATNLALMEDEVVQRRQWLTRERFLDLLGATNLIPGPNSTEMACHLGYVRGGLWGLVVAGFSFIVPATLLTAACAAWYVAYGQQPRVAPLIAGIKPAVLAIVFVAGWRLGRQVLKGWVAGLVAAAVAAAALAGASEIGALLAGGVCGMGLLLWQRRPTSSPPPAPDVRLGVIWCGALGWRAARAGSTAACAPLLAAAGAGSQAVSWAALAWFFLKVGAVLYGSGYVLIAYLQGDLVARYHWLTQEQLLDAIAVGQFTPGPILSTATFIGYLVLSRQGGWTAGLLGAVVATLAIFLPSFVLVAITHPWVPKLRNWRWTAAFLDAVNAASMGLMASVTLKLGLGLLFQRGAAWAPNWPALLISTLAVTAALRWKLGAVWLVLGGALAGLLLPSAT